MIAPFVLRLSLLGIMLNLSLAGLVIQPDWAAALLLAAILAQRGNWVWVLPGFWVHDLALHWSSLVCLPVVALIPFFLKKAAKLQKGGKTPGRDVAGYATMKQCREIAEPKMVDQNANDLDQGATIIAGSARSRGREERG